MVSGNERSPEDVLTTQLKIQILYAAELESRLADLNASARKIHEDLQRVGESAEKLHGVLQILLPKIPGFDDYCAQVRKAN